VHRARVAENDVLAQIIALKDDARRINEPLGDDAAPLGIDADHEPTVSVADLINTITATVVATLIDDEGLSARIGADLHSEVAALLGRAIKNE
jgi:hypothetical protein